MTTTIPRGAVTITRRQAHDADACVEDTRRVLNYLRRRDGHIPRMDQRISLQDVAAVLGIDGVVWCLVAVGGHDGLLRRFACVCARRALRRAGVRDPRSWRAVRVAWWYAHGWATNDDLDAAWDAARSAARGVAGDAARVAAHAASQDDVRDTAWAAAWAVARGAACGAVWDASWAAAWNAEREAQRLLLLSMSGCVGEA